MKDYSVRTNATMVREPVMESDCLNCGEPGTEHVDGKCLFEASDFRASKYVDTPVLQWKMDTTTVSANSTTSVWIPIINGSTACGEVTTQPPGTKPRGQTRDRSASIADSLERRTSIVNAFLNRRSSKPAPRITRFNTRRR